jgi:predicted RNA binding protein YcfA (HicA-like mRNA interferase family)
LLGDPMGRMAQIVAVRLLRALGRLGWAVERQVGSHAVLVKPGKNPVTVPVHRGKTLKEGTARAITSSCHPWAFWSACDIVLPHVPFRLAPPACCRYWLRPFPATSLLDALLSDVSLVYLDSFVWLEHTHFAGPLPRGARFNRASKARMLTGTLVAFTAPTNTNQMQMYQPANVLTCKGRVPGGLGILGSLRAGGVGRYNVQCVPGAVAIGPTNMVSPSV